MTGSMPLSGGRTQDLDDGQHVHPPRLRAGVHARDLVRRQDLFVDGRVESVHRLRLRRHAAPQQIRQLRDGAQTDVKAGG
jgi:hypothetical protein